MSSPSRPSFRLIQKLIADPKLPETVRTLGPSQLARLVDEVGLEDCGEILALATPAQIEGVFDEDLWRAPRPGADESFDPSRFGLWLEVLLELGAAKGSEKLAELDEDFLTMAISQLIWVVPFETLKSEVAAESLLEKVMESTEYHELEEFVIFSRIPSAWDSVLAFLVELDGNHHSFLRRILEACASFSAATIEDQGGLYTVLSAEDELKSDVAYEREKRREALGFVTPADARAFLKIASGPIEGEDHISPKKFREAAKGGTPASTPPQTQALQKSAHSGYPRVQAFLSAEPSSYSLRLEELNWLANVLMAGSQVGDRAPRPGEAAERVLQTCETGMTRRPQSRSLIEAFRAGWTGGRPR